MEAVDQAVTAVPNACDTAGAAYEVKHRADTHALDTVGGSLSGAAYTKLQERTSLGASQVNTMVSLERKVFWGNFFSPPQFFDGDEEISAKGRLGV